MAQTQTIGKHRTTVSYREGVTTVRYHSTDVVSVAPQLSSTSKGVVIIVTLDHGGHMTNTTKLRMNQTANQFGLGFRVYQKNFDWFVGIDTHEGTRIMPWGSDRVVAFAVENPEHARLLR
jgi:hypothetical protein